MLSDICCYKHIEGKIYPCHKREEGEDNDGLSCINRDALSVSGVRPLISQEAKTHKPQECPEHCFKHTEREREIINHIQIIIYYTCTYFLSHHQNKALCLKVFHHNYL